MLIEHGVDKLKTAGETVRQVESTARGTRPKMSSEGAGNQSRQPKEKRSWKCEGKFGEGEKARGCDIGGTDMLSFPGPECVDFGVNSFFSTLIPGLGLGNSCLVRDCRRRNKAFTHPS